MHIKAFILLFLFSIKAFIFEFFNIISTSMEPTFLSGGLAIIKKQIYNVVNNPKRGSIIVFKYPFRKASYIKRALGLPGDNIIYNNHHVIAINYKGIINKHVHILKDQKHILYRITINIHSSFKLARPFNKDLSNIILWFLPRLSYFVIGDYLNKSFDSRHWGVLPGFHIIGYILYIWFT